MKTHTHTHTHTKLLNITCLFMLSAIYQVKYFPKMWKYLSPSPSISNIWF